MAGPSLEGLVNPDMLVWAREQSRLSVSDAAQKVGQDSDGLRSWETGARVPTLSQLRQLADLYKRSVGIFMLRERPDVPRRLVDYRRLELSTDTLMSPTLANGLREAEAKREAALDIYAQLEEEPPPWDLHVSPNTSAAAAASAIAERLGVTMQVRSSWSNHYQALNGWRTAIESLGVIVVQLSRIPLDEMRGCSLALYPMPVIVLNGADSPLGRVFTLLHELTHLTRSESGLCDLREDTPRGRTVEAVEVFCNLVAGSILVPASDLLGRGPVALASRSTAWTSEQLSGMSRSYWASREAILRRLLDLGKTSRGHYQHMREQFRHEYQQQREQSDGFVAPHIRVMLSNGRVLTRLAVDAYRSQVITGSELSRVLNAKLDHLPKIKQALSAEVLA